MSLTQAIACAAARFTDQSSSPGKSVIRRSEFQLITPGFQSTVSRLYDKLTFNQPLIVAPPLK
jgi:hypothetical protein